MIVYVGQRYTARVSGSIVKDVTCEKCGDRYLYRMYREGTGQGSSPYYMDNDGAARRAEKRAAESVESKLKKQHEAVACPQCGWLQKDMIKDIRRRRLKWVMYVGLTVAVFGLIAMSIYGAANSRNYDDITPGLTLCGLISAGGVTLIPLRFWLNSRFNPNTVPNAGGWLSDCKAIRHADVVAAEREEQRRASGPVAAIPVTTAAVGNFPGDWYYTLNGTQHGPVNGEELQTMADLGTLDPASLVWNAALPSWVPAGSIEGLYTAATPADGNEFAEMPNFG